MSATDIQNRILTLHERQLASLVDDISRIEATSYNGIGVEKLFLHEGADVLQLASSVLVVLKYMPRNITPPLALRYGATDVPIVQLGPSSNSLPGTKLNDLDQQALDARGLSSWFRGEVLEFSRSLSKYSRLLCSACGPHQHIFHRFDQFLAAAFSLPREGFFPIGRRRPDAASCPRAAGHKSRGYAAIFRAGRAGSSANRGRRSD